MTKETQFPKLESAGREQWPSIGYSDFDIRHSGFVIFHRFLGKSLVSQAEHTMLFPMTILKSRDVIRARILGRISGLPDIRSGRILVLVSRGGSSTLSPPP